MIKWFVILVISGCIFLLSIFSEYSPFFVSPDSIILVEEKNNPISEIATTTATAITQKPVAKTTEVVPAQIQLPKLDIAPQSLPSPQALVATSTQVPEIVEAPPPPLPALNEKALLSAVVKIECPTNDGLGRYVATGFVVGERTVVTAAHVLKDSGSRTCSVIFPRERKPVYYFQGQTEDLEIIKKRHDEEGIDAAIIILPPIESYLEARAIFEKYPSIPYPLCTNPQMLEDSLLHFGYPSNFVDQNYLSKLEGLLVAHADIGGIKEALSEDQTYIYKTPIFKYTLREDFMHPYLVSQVPSFYGDSGGLAFNATKQCILGPHRGGTIGKSSGENYTVFMNLGWPRISTLTVFSGD